MPSSRQHPYQIRGKVLLNGTAYRGVKIWVMDMTSGGQLAPAIDGITYYSSDTDGAYSISLPDAESNYADNDTVRVYCETENGIMSWSDIVVDITVGRSVVNFTFVSLSAMVDGCKSSPTADRKGGLIRSQLNSGCNDGLQ